VGGLGPYWRDFVTTDTLGHSVSAKHRPRQEYVMSNVDLADLSKIPYINVKNLQGRFISTLMFHDAGAWRMWTHAGGELVEINAWPAEAFYFSAGPECSHDIYFHFIDFIAQRASYPDIQRPILGLRDDILNLSASVSKIAHLHTARNIIGSGVSRLVVTDVEYIFSVCRSIFDLLQEIICILWNSVQLTDRSVLKKPLKKTFSDTIQFKGAISTLGELASRFGLPQPLAEFYVRNSRFFMTLRAFRDNIIHHGSQVQTIFSDEQGFFIRESMRPFSTMNIWRENERQPNDLFPLLPALGVVIRNTIAACEDFSSTIENIVSFPPPIVPGMKLFMRGYFNECFTEILRDANDRVAVG
jgi:hypothetical protein